MMRVGVVAALPGELGPLVRGWARAGEVYLGELEPKLEATDRLRIYAASAGMGPAAATRAFSQVLAAAQAEGQLLDAVVSYGWAGAISCGVKPPQVYAVSEVIDTRTGERFAAQSGTGSRTNAPLRLITIDHVARSAEKRALAERYQAVLVDMEAATVARLASARELPFVCLKGISDGYMDVLPDFNRFLGHDGQLRVAAFVAHTLPRPAYWRTLLRLGANSRAAAQALAASLPLAVQGTGLVS